jgi:DNA-binding XRE family transcriptional regulator
MDKAMLIPAQLRAARALLDWSRKECGVALGVSAETIKNIESEKYKPLKGTVNKIMRTLSEYNIEFIGHHRFLGVVLIKNGKNHAALPENGTSKEHKK